MPVSAGSVEVAERARSLAAPAGLFVGASGHRGLPLGMLSSVFRYPASATASHCAPKVAQRRHVEESAARAAPKIQLVVALVLVPSVLLMIAAALIANAGVLLAGF